MWAKTSQSNDLFKSLTVSVASPQTLSTAGLVNFAEKTNMRKTGGKLVDRFHEDLRRVRKKKTGKRHPNQLLNTLISPTIPPGT